MVDDECKNWVKHFTLIDKTLNAQHESLNDKGKFSHEI